MKEIVIISGKGGTGKTSVSASLAVLSEEESVIADCDVDAADMHLLLSPDFSYSEEFFSGQIAVINNENCTSCGLCAEKCRFDAIKSYNGFYSVTGLDCEGCGYCARICPPDAIEMRDRKSGDFYISGTRINAPLIHASLDAGAENSGKLVAKVKKEARIIAEKENRKYIIADGSPGTGCPVISSLSGADLVIIVTEPTVSGIHDLKRVYELVKKFNIKAACIINKYDVNPEMSIRIREFINSESIVHLADIPYDRVFTDSIIKGHTVVESGHADIEKMLKETWDRIKQIID